MRKRNLRLVWSLVSGLWVCISPELILMRKKTNTHTETSNEYHITSNDSIIPIELADIVHLDCLLTKTQNALNYIAFRRCIELLRMRLENRI